tara:strand:- start:19 stop:171 length:153 start_codon:yes stop_codon:yes gene_type:complete
MKNQDEFNREFYVTCSEYFNALRKSDKSDDRFEDEYFFTLPGVSGSGLNY